MREHRCDRDGAGAHGQGTYACYVICRCRCWDCARTRSDYELRRSRRAAQGRPLTVPVDDTYDHLQELLSAGMGYRRISKLSGVGTTAIQKILRGKTQRVRTTTAEAIASVPPGHLAEGARVPAGPTQRRIREMVDGGWTKVGIARHLHGPNAQALQLSDRKVTVFNARRIAQLHRDWKDGLVDPATSRRGQRPDTDQEEHRDVA